MDAEQLKLVLDVVGQISGDAKEVFMYIYLWPMLKSLIIQLAWVGAIVYIIMFITKMVKISLQDTDTLKSFVTSAGVTHGYFSYSEKARACRVLEKYFRDEPIAD